MPETPTHPTAASVVVPDRAATHAGMRAAWQVRNDAVARADTAYTQAAGDPATPVAQLQAAALATVVTRALRTNPSARFLQYQVPAVGDGRSPYVRSALLADTRGQAVGLTHDGYDTQLSPTGATRERFRATGDERGLDMQLDDQTALLRYLRTAEAGTGHYQHGRLDLATGRREDLGSARLMAHGYAAHLRHTQDTLRQMFPGTTITAAIAWGTEALSWIDGPTPRQATEALHRARDTAGEPNPAIYTAREHTQAFVAAVHLRHLGGSPQLPPGRFSPFLDLDDLDAADLSFPEWARGRLAAEMLSTAGPAAAGALRSAGPRLSAGWCAAVRTLVSYLPTLDVALREAHQPNAGDRCPRRAP